MSGFDNLETYRRMLRINKHRLDEELELQAELMDRISSKVAVLNSRALEAKEDLSRVEARLFMGFKEDGISNESANAEVRKDPERKTAWQRYQVARQEQEEWQGLLNAWTARGYHLKVIADLYIGQYFTVNSVRGPSPEENVEQLRSNMRRAAEEKKEERKEPQPTGMRRRPLT